MEISKPLRYSINIQRKNGQEWIAKVKYERLPAHCFFCGMIDYVQNRCKLCFDADQSHIVTHGCDPLAKCPNLPQRLFGIKIKGNPPSVKLLERAKYLDSQRKFTGQSTLTESSSSENKRNLNRQQEGEQLRLEPIQVQSTQSIIPSVQYPRSINGSQFSL
ncbi:hypothetical protein NE237_024177 [Protea cynaroides]|uniref:Zinc knuckle CX2CX4HX4C domain-containing protein n=1 Tax=Protea cynaroides TaxID=273540 RepID=A0A9Q0HGD7_9MAGN|nr:hypothetical protein NE237_024177 [Protea cynaroides]